MRGEKKYHIELTDKERLTLFYFLDNLKRDDINNMYPDGKCRLFSTNNLLELASALKDILRN